MIKDIEFRMLVLANSNIVNLTVPILNGSIVIKVYLLWVKMIQWIQIFGTQMIVFDSASVKNKIKDSSCFAPLYPFPPEIGLTVNPIGDMIWNVWTYLEQSIYSSIYIRTNFLHWFWISLFHNNTLQLLFLWVLDSEIWNPSMQNT